MKTHLLNLLFFICVLIPVSAQNRHAFPDVEGFLTLKGEMHIHTIFSDGNVWPTSRIDEAWLDGLDVVCITDHIDERHKRMVKSGLFNCDRNESYRIAAEQGKKRGIIVVHGGEVTRRMPPGHFNTLFLSDCEAVAALNDAEEDHYKAMDASLTEAHKQGSFNVWNHPHWSVQAPNETKWYPEHSKLEKKGLMDGIEIYNSCDGYSPEAHQWAIDRNLTLIGGSDSHSPIAIEMNYNAGELRPCTLIFSKERSVEGVKEALQARRTAVYGDGKVYGSEEVLIPLIKASLELTEVKFNETSCEVTFVNRTNIPLILSKAPGSERLQYKRFQIIYPQEKVKYRIGGGDYYKAPLTLKEFDLSFYIENFHTAPHRPLLYKIRLTRPN